MCGGDLDVTEDVHIAKCPYCGATQTLPKTNDGVIANLYNRAHNLRLKCEFDKAEKMYDKIIELDDTQSEAHWGIVLCKYGIEYIEDPKTFNMIPTCHRTLYNAVLSDVDYVSAIENADSSQKELYEIEAKQIDEIQKNILSVARGEQPFDVFICYKETDENGKRTIDSVIANDIYYQLTQEGFKVFYSAITLEDKLGYEYEPYIFAALNSAKVMLVLGTKPEYFDSVWVRNEWSRYLRMIKTNNEKLLIPCYRDMDAYELPEEFAHLQAQDMSKIGFINDVIRGIKKVVVSEPLELNSDTNISPLLKRAFMFLEDENWNSAVEYSERVLDIEPENPQAYLIKLMVDLRIKDRANLKYCSNSFESNLNYKRIVQYGDESLLLELKNDIEYINQTYLENKYNSVVSEMEKCDSEESFKSVAVLFDEIINFKDSNTLKDTCLTKAEELRKEKSFETAINFAFNDYNVGAFTNSIRKLENAIDLFSTITNYKNSKELIEKCKKQIEWLENDFGTLKLVFLKNVNNDNLSILIDEKFYHIGKVYKDEEKTFRLHSGLHKISIDNNVNFLFDIVIERDKTKECNISKNIFGDYIIKKIN